MKNNVNMLSSAQQNTEYSLQTQEKSSWKTLRGLRPLGFSTLEFVVNIYGSACRSLHIAPMYLAWGGMLRMEILTRRWEKGIGWSSGRWICSTPVSFFDSSHKQLTRASSSHVYKLAQRSESNANFNQPETLDSRSSICKMNCLACLVAWIPRLVSGSRKTTLFSTDYLNLWRD